MSAVFSIVNKGPRFTSTIASFTVSIGNRFSKSDVAASAEKFRSNSLKPISTASSSIVKMVKLPEAPSILIPLKVISPEDALSLFTTPIKPADIPECPRYSNFDESHLKVPENAPNLLCGKSTPDISISRDTLNCSPIIGSFKEGIAKAVTEPFNCTC